MKINGNPDGGGGKSAVIESLSVTSNGTYTAGGGVDGYSPVSVSVPERIPVTESLSVSVNSTYYPGQGVDGFSQVIVDVPQSVTGYTEKEITEQDYGINNLSNSASFVHSNAFNTNYELNTVYLPNAVSVGMQAFQNCAFLSSVNLPACEVVEQSAFVDCERLADISLPVCTEIGVSAFAGCNQSLTSISLPMVKSISGYAFYNCNALQTVSLPVARSIAQYAFRLCSALESIYFPMCLSISNSAFQNCPSLRTIDLPDCLYIGNSVFAFGGAQHIETLNLPMVNTLGNSAFDATNPDWNTTLSVLSLPHLVQAINTTFRAFRSVVSLNLPIISTNTQISATFMQEVSYGNRIYLVPTYNNNLPNFDYKNASIYVDAAMYDSWAAAPGWSDYSDAFVSFGDPSIPMLSLSGTQLIGKTWAVFYNISKDMGIDINSIYSASLPECTHIHQSAFSYCQNMTEIDIPNCEYIGSSAFAYCMSLSYISLPKCSFIGEGAFYQCTSLTNIRLDLSSVCTLIAAKNTFASNTYIYVPASLVDAYKAADEWSAYSSHIYSIPSPVIEGYYFSYTPTNLSGRMQVQGEGMWENISSYNGLYNNSNWWDGVIYEEAFYDAQNSTTISFVSFETNANGVNGYAFSGCTTLTTVRFTDTTNGVYVADYAFDGCTSLSTVYVVLSEWTCTWEENAFAGTPLANGSGSIYVPSAVYNDYLQEYAEAPFVTQFVSY